MGVKMKKILIFICVFLLAVSFVVIYSSGKNAGIQKEIEQNVTFSVIDYELSELQRDDFQSWNGEMDRTAFMKLAGMNENDYRSFLEELDSYISAILYCEIQNDSTYNIEVIDVHGQSYENIWIYNGLLVASINDIHSKDTSPYCFEIFYKDINTLEYYLNNCGLYLEVQLMEEQAGLFSLFKSASQRYALNLQYSECAN